MLNRILAAFVALIEAIVPPKPTTPYEAQVQALVEKIDADAKVALQQSVDLVEAAATLTIKSQNTRAYSRKLSGLAGRLDAVLTDA